MNLKQLQFVSEVAKTKSFSKAAERCFATQPTLSNAIAQLEKELGGRLFIRTTRKVELTAFGDFLLSHIDDVLLSRDELLKAAESFLNPTHKMLRIGFSPLVDMQRLDQLLEPYRQAHPDVTIFFKECFLDELSSRLQSEQIDFQVCPSRDTSDSESACLFYSDPLYYLPAKGGEGETVHLSFRLSELPKAPIILTGGGCGLNAAVEKLYAKHGVSLQPYAGQALTYRVIEDWASLGIGAGILPKGKLSPDNQAAYPLFEDKSSPASFQFDWVWNADRNMPEYLEHFVVYISSTVPLLDEGRAASGRRGGG